MYAHTCAPNQEYEFSLVIFIYLKETKAVAQVVFQDFDLKYLVITKGL